ncbi:hypothetical protein QN399_00850 [Pseudomonas sp. 10C3]|uniref:hypothetical protein n=1 Tax=Pseudomonas sp. 10C3 TaxID=3118753 RepID=UPI002E8235C0|nr:hypothetical protein [Pseudomonas sp. 10C3]MEE3504823.1 hypothetical protein [Pseudomonas sp. 10C3]
MATNDFLPFGGAVGANVMTQAAYLALAARTSGFSSGTANSAQLNKAWRQSSIMAAMIGQFIADQSGQNAVDDGTTATLEANFLSAAKGVSGNVFALDTGVANAYVCAFVPAVVARSEGQVLRFKVKTTNTGASTFNDGLGAVALVGGAQTALQGSELIANGDAWVQWNTSIGGGAYILLFCTGAPEQVAPAIQSQQAIQLSQMAAVVGGVRNGKMSISTASATATYTADEIAVKSSLGGAAWLLSNFNKAINLATSGAGGMDTGTVPATGYIAIYATYNPTSGVSALLAVNATSASATEVYSGANMPSGYTASALVSVQRVASSLFTVGSQTDRTVYTALTTVLSTSTQQGTATALNISTYAPLNAKSCHGTLTLTSSASGSNLAASIGGSGASIGTLTLAISNTGVGGGIVAPFHEIPISTPQTIYYVDSASTGTISFAVALSEYTF